MDIKNIVSTIGSLVPFWASSLIEYFGLGNEYTMLFNIILQQILHPLELYVTETILYCVFTICCVFAVCYKNSLIDPNMFKLYNKKSLTINGDEKDDIIDYCRSMNALTQCFIEEYDYNDILITQHTKHHIMLKNVKQRRLKNDLYLDIFRFENKVMYTLSSYNIDLNKFVADATKKYDLLQDKNYIHLYGTETKTTYNYSDTLIALSYTLVHKYGFNNLINKKSVENDGDRQMDDDGDKFKKYLSRAEKINHDKKLKITFLIDEYNNHKLEEDVYISIIRLGETVKFSLYSSTQNLIEFLDKCDTYYTTNFNNTKFKYRLILQGSETSENRSKSKMVYPKEMMAINYHLIFVHKHRNYRIVENFKMTLDKYGDNVVEYDEIEDSTVNMFKYILEDVGSITFEDITLSIKRYQGSAYNSGSTIVDYIFESDTVDLETYIDNLTKKYDKMNNEKNKNKLYHFTLTSIDDGCPEFSTELIYDKEPLLFEDFNNISSVHNDLLINDMKKLKDIDYYRKTGMKRKKSYLFYGKPGCGKTSSIIAMAMHDKRHIIEIPMSLILTCQDLDAVMNLREIDDITFTNDETIILFDEIDIGMTSNLLNQQIIESKSTTDLATTIISELQKKEKDDAVMVSAKKHISSYIAVNVGALLSKFDGISNYNGKIIIATTNNKEKIDPAICRPQRLTPIYFTYCRKIDIVNIINKFYMGQKFEIDFDLEITPAKLTFLCEKYDHEDVNVLIDCLKQIC